MAYPFAFLLTSLLILPAALGADVLGACSLLNCPCDRYVLKSGESLKKYNNDNNYLSSSRGRCVFKLQSDCNLYLYDFSESSQPKWHTTVTIDSEVNRDNLNCVLKMQLDGNLVLYDDDNNDNHANVLWQSFTADGGFNQDGISRNSSLVLWDDCSIKVYQKASRNYPPDN